MVDKLRDALKSLLLRVLCQQQRLYDVFHQCGSP